MTAAVLAEVVNNTTAEKLQDASSLASDFFGRSIAFGVLTTGADADVLVVGSPGADDNGALSGAITIFEKSGGTWSKTTRIAGEAAGDEYGSAVAIHAGTIVVGAPNESTTAADSGAVYVYTKSMGTWTLQQKIKMGTPVANIILGCSVTINGDVLVAGGRHQSSGQTGTARSWTRSGSTWGSETSVPSADTGADDYYGKAVAFDGSTLVVGASNDNTGRGFAAVFAYAAGTFTETQILRASDAADYDYFGEAVAVSGSLIAIGAPGEDDGGSASGALYVFENVSGTWTQRQKCVNALQRASDGMCDEGSLCILAGSTVVAGAKTADPNSATSSGAVFAFSPNPDWATGYTSRELFVAPPVASDAFGAAVAAYGDEIAVGEDNGDGPVANCGAAYIVTPEWASSATNVYLMQAKDDTTGDVYLWVVTGTPDWAGASYPGPNTATDIVISGRLWDVSE